MDNTQNTSKPNSSRRNNRICAVQFLYMWSMNPDPDLPHVLYRFFSLMEEPRGYYSFAESLINGALGRLEDVDVLIQAHAKNWAFSRIGKVDLAILRLAIYELLYRTDIPPIVSINESIEISKSLSSLDSKRFINGILDKVKATLTRSLRGVDKPNT